MKVLECAFKANGTAPNTSHRCTSGSSKNFPPVTPPAKPEKGIPHTGELLQAPLLAQGGGSTLSSRAEEHELTNKAEDSRD